MSGPRGGIGRAIDPGGTVPFMVLGQSDLVIVDRLGLGLTPTPSEHDTVAALAQGLRKQQGNFAGESWRAPIKTHLSPELASDHVFYNAGAAPAVRGGRDGRPACFAPAQTELSACPTRPCDFNVTICCR
jgi:hypothetical protein